MTLDWDPDKSRQNRRKHGFGLEEAQAVFQDRELYVEYDEREYGDERWAAIGRLGSIIAYVVYTNRAGVVRLISARKANHEEESRYYRRWL